MTRRTRLSSVNDAIEGIIHALRHQANIRFHFYAAALVLILAGVLGISSTEFMIVVLVIGLVLASELINSAVEASIDLIADHYHPLAKIVKDTAAGAVLVTSVGAAVCGWIIFYPHLASPLSRGALLVKHAPAYITMVALVIVIILVLAAKARLGKGTPLAGGMPSGHAALAFGIFTAVALSSGDALVTVLAFVLAVMVSHSRLIYRIHTLREVVAGAILGALIMLLLFQLLA